MATPTLAYLINDVACTPRRAVPATTTTNTAVGNSNDIEIGGDSTIDVALSEVFLQSSSIVLSSGSLVVRKYNSTGEIIGNQTIAFGAFNQGTGKVKIFDLGQINESVSFRVIVVASLVF
jgi:hypothetical protein